MDRLLCPVFENSDSPLVNTKYKRNVIVITNRTILNNITDNLCVLKSELTSICLSICLSNLS